MNVFNKVSDGIKSNSTKAPYLIFILTVTKSPPSYCNLSRGFICSAGKSPIPIKEEMCRTELYAPEFWKIPQAFACPGLDETPAGCCAAPPCHFPLEGEDIVRYIKSQRIRWLGHVYRMEGERVVKRILEWKPQNTRPKGRPKKRWIDDVEEDLKTLRIGNWRRTAVDRTRWRNIVEQAKTHRGLWTKRRRRRSEELIAFEDRSVYCTKATYSNKEKGCERRPGFKEMGIRYWKTIFSAGAPLVVVDVRRIGGFTYDSCPSSGFNLPPLLKGACCCLTSQELK
ncbi:hypothetical protein NQ317_008066 [Molorchus minor]|uniref:Uncharacterized protein n=1 Tax=Molorchus minor TaxID=1323400 RepID=A0ABQ9JMW9_9CUCU|nr:hypothetical protein NQ317_008066 [Molorchus minor]